MRRAHRHSTDWRWLWPLVLLLCRAGIAEGAQGSRQEGIESLTQPRSIARTGHAGLAEPRGRRRFLMKDQTRVWGVSEYVGEWCSVGRDVRCERDNWLVDGGV